MALPLPTGRQGHLLSLGILAVLLALVWFALIGPVVDFYVARAEQLADQRRLAARMMERADELPSLRQRLANATAKTGAMANPLLSGASDAVAAATLQDTLQQMAADSGATISSVESLPVETVEGFRRIGIRLNLKAGHPALAALLGGIDRATPPMVVDDLVIRGSPLPIVNAPDVLDVSLSVFAFRAADQGHAAS